MLANVTEESLARALFSAERNSEPIAPLVRDRPDLDVAAAYAVQRAGRELRLAGGDELRGHKVGLTSQAMQEMLGVRQPDFGYLLASMLVPAGGSIALEGLIAPRVEAEIAFYLGERLSGPGVTPEQVMAATSQVAPALEVIDSRIADWEITLVDTVADNASSARAVIGEPIAAHGLDLAELEGRLTVGGEKVVGRGDAVLGHPSRAVAWLANTLADFGEALEPGEVIIPGAIARALPVQAGSVARADFGQLGSVEVRFE
ncbi:MAG: 2-keto-4-pentenoate hydratase [Thermoleophilaceae bacterium]|jgi:2-keto-4-pentenoate hydratase|nr:2-keto-4-pentenoate hydratase [Thermoleophilaceae bacterium]